MSSTPSPVLSSDEINQNHKQNPFVRIGTITLINIQLSVTSAREPLSLVEMSQTCQLDTLVSWGKGGEVPSLTSLLAQFYILGFEVFSVPPLGDFVSRDWAEIFCAWFVSILHIPISSVFSAGFFPPGESKRGLESFLCKAAVSLSDALDLGLKCELH